jgi:hypothetical protein
MPTAHESHSSTPSESIFVRVWYASQTDVFIPDDLTYQLSVSMEERLTLDHALASYLGDLRMEISGTDNAQMRRDLRTEERLLTSIRTRLDVGAAPASAGSPSGP